MKNPLKRITIAFLLIACIPVGFMIYELGLINRNEQMVRATYENQLDAILYSVNQYSDDIISSWANRVRVEVAAGEESTLVDRLRSVLNQVDVVPYLFIFDQWEKSVIYPLGQEEGEPGLQKILHEIVMREQERVNRLIDYEKAGFRKVEAIDTLISGKRIPVFFVLDEGSGKYSIGALVVDLPLFITNNLGPKMQAISQGQFVISAYQFKNDSLVFSTEAVTLSSDVSGVFRNQIQKKDFWLLPGYYLAITLKGATIDDLVRDRTTTSLTILVLLILTLSVGIFFLYRNIRREIFLSQAKSEFVSNVSHEIRTPLSLIGMFAETLEMGRVTSEEKKREYYTIIGKETARLSRMINRILNFSQLEANKKTFTFESLQLNNLCQEVLTFYEDHLKEKGFEILFSPDGTPEPIRGDREALSEVLINLLDNAIKYSREHKHITVLTGKDQKSVFVEITDKGIGIARHHLDEIFDQFFRAPTGDVHNTKGSGLGLTLVKRIMEAHGGQVKVESALGRGSTFRLIFPYKQIIP